MHDLTILSIFRNSATYLDRYAEQVRGVLDAFDGSVRLVWLEGDSVDDTPVRLASLSCEMNERYHADVTLSTFGHGGPPYPSIDTPERWRQLSGVWNRNLAELQPTCYAACIEADLIWQPDDLLTCIKHLDMGICDVAYPLLMLRDTHQFYDTHANRTPEGQVWSAWPPYAPQWNGKRFVPVQTAGGMVVTHGETLADATWGETDCVLHFAPETRCVVDMHTWIRHP